MNEKKQYLVEIGMIFLFSGLIGVVFSFLSGDIIRNIIVNIAQFNYTDEVYTRIDMTKSTLLSYFLLTVGIGMIAIGIILAIIRDRNKKNYNG